jgi:hypothetical protein
MPVVIIPPYSVDTSTIYCLNLSPILPHVETVEVVEVFSSDIYLVTER